MSTRKDQQRRTKHNGIAVALGALALSMILFVVVFYAIDDFNLYWFVLVNQDDVTDRRVQDDREWYDSHDSGYSGDKKKPGTSGGGNTITVPNQNINADGSPGYTIKGGDLSLTTLLEQFEVDDMATPEFACRFIIYKLDQAGYVRNAAIGALAYMMAEGMGMGTFTYESYYCKNNGPSDQSWCKILDNQTWLDWMNGPGKERGYALYRGMGYNDRSCIGLGLPQYTDRWNLAGDKTVSNATAFIERANEAGVYWQDPMWQTDDVIATLDSDRAWDIDQNPGVDPRSSTSITATEWCARVTCGVGQPSWNWVTTSQKNGKYYNDHVSQVDAAESLYDQYSGTDPLFYSLTGRDVNSYLYPFLGPSYDNSTPQGLLIARMALLLASGDEQQGDVSIKMDGVWGYDAPNLKNCVTLQYYREALQTLEAGTIYYASCDRGVNTALRLAGVDGNFPWGGTSVQYDYVNGSGKSTWENVGVWGEVQMQPGDVILTDGSGHIKIWLGENVAGERWPGTTATVYQASYNNYYPFVSREELGADRKGRAYHVYRCTNTELSSQWWDKFISAKGSMFPELPPAFVLSPDANPDSEVSEYTGEWYWPLPDRTIISSFYGNRPDPFTGEIKNHKGTDIPAPEGTPLYAAKDGTVSYVCNNTDGGGFGYHCIIDHGDGITTLYAHQSQKPPVTEGQSVTKGDLIGYVGSTGRSTGPHLHYEVRVNGNRDDVLKLYPGMYFTSNKGGDPVPGG